VARIEPGDGRDTLVIDLANVTIRVYES